MALLFCSCLSRGHFPYQISTEIDFGLPPSLPLAPPTIEHEPITGVTSSWEAEKLSQSVIHYADLLVGT